MYSNDALAMPKLYADVGRQSDASLRHAQHAVVHRRHERDRRWIVGDGFDSDDALVGAVGEAQRGRARREPKGDRPPIAFRGGRNRVAADARDDAAAISATAQREHATRERSNVVRLIDRERMLAAVRGRRDFGDERRKTTRALADPRTVDRITGVRRANAPTAALEA